MIQIGQVISGKYKLLRLLGDGGMGSVYEAEHLVLGTHVALKILHTDLARRAGLIDRFLQEARVSAQIRSPHVVHVTDVERSPEGVASPGPWHARQGRPRRCAPGLTGNVSPGAVYLGRGSTR